VACVRHRIEQKPDSDGQTRDAILFGLLPVEHIGTTGQTFDGPSLDEADFKKLRKHLLGREKKGVKKTTRQRVQEVFVRSQQVVTYALTRADGVCEACKNEAPFIRKSGQPYLEVHHIHRLSDGGPDEIDSVAAICPNCHRRCHYSTDAAEFNAAVGVEIRLKEGSG
jgi:5-methylcytosine-specific restriction protein A